MHTAAPQHRHGAIAPKGSLAPSAWEPEASTESARPPAAPSATPPQSTTQRLHAAADTVMFVGLVNLLVIAFTLAGAVVLGWAPAVAAATAVSRRRLRHQAFGVLRTFAEVWRTEFGKANLLQAPGNLLILILTTNALALRAAAGPGALVVASFIAAGLVVTYQVILVAMDANYELPRTQAWRLAGQFLVRFPAAPALLAATLALIVGVTLLIPGLLPVLSIGAGLYLCTALCLSFFATNDRNAQP